ncbi:uncharacterized protein [Aristolochia californica]|uniref:uncharacterized protein isoform X6 n=1 Tax=Aristolochia californica TaxID=171875 RepID=UPI0035DB25AD
MVSFFNVLVYGVGSILVAGMALLATFQEKLVYVPVLPGLTKSYPITPARLRLKYEDVWLTSSDGVRLHAWFIKLFPDCRGPTMLFFQENAGNIAHRLEFVRIMLQRLQCMVQVMATPLKKALQEMLRPPWTISSREPILTWLGLLSLEDHLVVLLDQFLQKTIPIRLNNRFYFCLVCKMRWFPLLICRCFMLKHQKTTGDAYLLIFPQACIWIRGCLVVIGIGDLFSCFLSNIFQRAGRMTVIALQDDWSFLNEAE